MNNLFSEPIHLNLPDSDIYYYPNFLASDIALNYFEIFKKTILWQKDDIKIFGKVHAQPRLTALYASNKKPYSYSGITMQPHVFTKELLELKKLVEEKSNTLYTTCLLNLYRNGKDSNGWHADNEKELGINPTIASVSLGQKRIFHLKHRTHKNLKYKIELENGSLLIMAGETQHHWLHQIPKTAKPIQPRINLTFRSIT